MIGNVTEDVFLRVARFPEPGETLLASDALRDCGGKGANRAGAAARYGADVAFVGAVGSDEAGRRLAEVLRQEPLDLKSLHTFDLPTDPSFVFVRSDAENLIVSTAAGARALRPDHASAISFTSRSTVLIQGDLCHEATRALPERARDAGARAVFNAAPIPERAHRFVPPCDVLVVNRGGSWELTGGADPEEAARRLRAGGAGEVVVALGAGGAHWLAPDAASRRPAPQVDVRDTTGAGDVFCGVPTAAVHRGVDLPAALEHAIGAASVSASHPGTYRAIPHLDAEGLPC